MSCCRRWNKGRREAPRPSHYAEPPTSERCRLGAGAGGPAALGSLLGERLAALLGLCENEDLVEAALAGDHHVVELQRRSFVHQLALVEALEDLVRGQHDPVRFERRAALAAVVGV